MSDWENNNEIGDFVIFHFEGNIFTETPYSTVIHHKNILSFGTLCDENILKSKRKIDVLPLVGKDHPYYFYDISDYQEYMIPDFLTCHLRNKIDKDEYLELAVDTYNLAKNKQICRSKKCKYSPCRDERVGHLIHWHH